MDLRAKITDVLSVHEYAGKPGGPDCGGICDCPDLCTCGAQVRSWRQHTADAVMGVVEPRIAAALELHQPYTVTDNPMDLCRTCDTIYPCATKLALDGGT